jgi:hypothetical protein
LLGDPAPGARCGAAAAEGQDSGEEHGRRGVEAVAQMQAVARLQQPSCPRPSSASATAPKPRKPEPALHNAGKGPAQGSQRPAHSLVQRVVEQLSALSACPVLLLGGGCSKMWPQPASASCHSPPGVPGLLVAVGLLSCPGVVLPMQPFSAPGRATLSIHNVDLCLAPLSLLAGRARAHTSRLAPAVSLPASHQSTATMLQYLEWRIGRAARRNWPPG